MASFAEGKDYLASAFAICKQNGMNEAPTPTVLANAAGISVPYASQILSDKPAMRRIPPRSLAIRIMRCTGWRHPMLAGLTEHQIDTLETVDPWTPRSTDTQAAA